MDSSAAEADSDWAEDMMLDEDDSGGEDSVSQKNTHQWVLKQIRN